MPIQNAVTATSRFAMIVIQQRRFHMPLYEYECSDCHQEVELLVRSADERVECPGCGGKKMTKLMSAPSAPNMNGKGGSLPVAGAGESCGAPRCCGGGMCQ